MTWICLHTHDFFILRMSLIWDNQRALPFVCVEVLRPSQPNGVMSSVVILPNYTFTGQTKSSKWLTSIVHILSPENDNCPSWISGRERMTVQNISWSISTKECCRPRRGLNLWPPGLQLDSTSNWATEANTVWPKSNKQRFRLSSSWSDHYRPIWVGACHTLTFLVDSIQFRQTVLNIDEYIQTLN